MVQSSVMRLGVMLGIVAAGWTTTAGVAAQKGKPPSRLAGTASFATVCGDPDPRCGVSGDGSGYTWQGDAGFGASMISGTKEMNLTIGGGFTATLDFGNQYPDVAPPADCSVSANTCLLNWTNAVRQFATGFEMQSNTLDPLGETELTNGLLDIPVGHTTRARLNMTVTMPETPTLFWRFNFNPNIPSTGGADLAYVTRDDACTWTFANGTHAALSTLVKDKGKSYVHREGRYDMPLRLTFRVPSLCPSTVS